VSQYQTKVGVTPGESAVAKLQRAVARLEAAVTSRTEVGGPDPGELVVALEAAQKENADLHQATAVVTNRLDTAIGRLKSVLGR